MSPAAFVMPTPITVDPTMAEAAVGTGDKPGYSPSLPLSLVQVETDTQTVVVAMEARLTHGTGG